MNIKLTKEGKVYFFDINFEFNVSISEISAS